MSSINEKVYEWPPVEYVYSRKEYRLWLGKSVYAKRKYFSSFSSWAGWSCGHGTTEFVRFLGWERMPNIKRYLKEKREKGYYIKVLTFEQVQNRKKELNLRLIGE